MALTTDGPIRVRLDQDPPRLHILRNDHTILSTGAPPAMLQSRGRWHPVTRVVQYHETDGGVQIKWETDSPDSDLILGITDVEDGFAITWQAEGPIDGITVAYDLESAGHWYGQGELIHQRWPLEEAMLPMWPLFTWDNGPTGLGNVQTPLWWTSTGAGIWVEEDLSLLVGLNAPRDDKPIPQWKLGPDQAPAEERPRRDPGDVGDGLLRLAAAARRLTHMLFLEDHLPEAYTHFASRAGTPADTPPERLLHEPIWTTWARYKTDIDQHRVLEFAREIRNHNFPGGTLEIDDRWQREYGDLAFDSERFPDPPAMIDELHALGFKVTLWVVPFADPACNNFDIGRERHYFVEHPEEGAPYLVEWWQGDGALLDVSSPSALDWFRDQLRALQEESGTDGFKFDAGEASYMPQDAITAEPLSRNGYSQRWAAFAAEHFPYSEVRAGWRSHQLPVLFREWDKFSTWGLDNGLAATITQALALSLTGHPFILPDMIGGNEYWDRTASKELMIRWTQASALMPAMQFSLAPWDFDAETVDICRRYAELHLELGDEIVTLARQATETGEPIIRPLFWAAPADSETHTIADEFLLGSRYLVAPVLAPETESRDVYLPAGRWRDYWSGDEYAGPSWLRDYPAPLNKLPLLVRRSQ